MIRRSGILHSLVATQSRGSVYNGHVAIIVEADLLGLGIPKDPKRNHISCFSLFSFRDVVMDMRPYQESRRRGPGICAIRGNCGPVSRFGQDLPCPDDGDATEVSGRYLHISS